MIPHCRTLIRRGQRGAWGGDGDLLVRFYRRTLKSMQELAGTVEHVGSGERAGFASREQLLDCLLKSDKGAHAETPTAGIDESSEEAKKA